MRVQLAIHVRTSRIVGQFIRLIKTMLNNKMQQRVSYFGTQHPPTYQSNMCHVVSQIHDVGTDFKTLKQHIPSRMLPADYGGDGPSLEQLTSRMQSTLQAISYKNLLPSFKFHSEYRLLEETV